MEITWETITLILGVGLAITGLISFVAGRKKATEDKVKSEMLTDSIQDKKLTALEVELRSLQGEVKEMKQAQISLEARIFTAINDLGKKLDNLITTLITQK